MCKKPLFLSLFLGKRGQIGKKSQKSCCGHQLRTMAYFSKYHSFDPLLYLGCQMLRTHFFFTFSAKNRSNNKIFGKKNLRASTRSHDPLFDNHKIYFTFIYRGRCACGHICKASCVYPNYWPKKIWPKKGYFSKNPSFGNVSYFLK